VNGDNWLAGWLADRLNVSGKAVWLAYLQKGDWLAGRCGGCLVIS